MDIFPIWKSTYFFLSGDNAVVRIIAEDGVVIYRARVSRIPDEDYMHVNLNKPCQAYIDSRIVPVDTEDAVYPMDAYEEFVLQQLNESTGVWADIYSFAFKNDWSYEDTDTLSEPINGHAAAGQVVSLSYLVTGNTESVCYDVVCPEPGPTPPPPPPPTPTGDTNDYLTFQIVSGGTIRYFSPYGNRTVQYTRDGNTWNTLSHQGTLNVSAGEIIKWKGVVPGLARKQDNFGVGTAKYNVWGNVMSLLYGDNYSGQTDMGPYAFYGLFADAGVVSAQYLNLPADAVPIWGYARMFESCTALTQAPVLPATLIGENCYTQMFAYCSSLVTAPALPATYVRDGSYSSMFLNCTSLVNAPALPATEIEKTAYAQMFLKCTSLVTAPELPVIVPPVQAYRAMFWGCTSLQYVKCLATRIYTDDTYGWVTLDWMYEVPASGTFVTPAPSIYPRDEDGIPAGWTISNA